MKRATSYEHDLFISYAHDDNEPPIEGQAGWVSTFHHALEVFLRQLGVKPRVWRDLGKLRGNEAFAEKIAVELGNVALLIPVLSPAFLASDWCRMELTAFHKVCKATGGAREGQQSRIFKVIKRQIPLKDQPPEIQNLLGYEFFRHDPETGSSRQLHPEVPTDYGAFLAKVEDLARDICGLIKRLREGKPVRPVEPEPAGKVTLYVAESTIDVRAERDQLLRSLRQREYGLLPDASLSTHGPELREEVSRDLARCQLSIHLLGANYGTIPEAEDLSIAELQTELAAEWSASNPDFCRLIWLSPDLEPAEDRQRNFIAKLRNDSEAQQGAEILQGSLEELKTVISDKLRPAPPALARAGPVATPGFNPFPGLRPFKASEAHLFFGRDEQVSEVLRRLREHRFLAVVGPSGSGKSSLVRAGILPRLLDGFSDSTWRVAEMRPGSDPVGNLARALADPEVLGPSGQPKDKLIIPGVFMETTLRRGALGLVEAVRQGGLGAGEHLLVLVDQFEELFRFEEAATSVPQADDAKAFVKLLLEATRQSAESIFVILTMRSDYLGDCGRFRDLPEAINDGQYLIPRMTRDQLREAIMGPAAVGGAEVSRRLLQRLLGEVGDDPDQLPILQHALMRAWDLGTEQDDGHLLDLPQYEATGGMAEALSRHADEAYRELPDERSREIAERLFKRLTEKISEDREIRRPTRLGEICAVTGAEKDEVIRVVEVFRQPGRSFLTPPAGMPLTEDSTLDISHESLMRVWQRLKRWVQEEFESARRYKRLADSAALHEDGQGGWMPDPELSITLEWRDREQPNEHWAEPYDPAFERAMDFLENSREKRDDEALKREERRRRELKRTRKFAAILGSAFVVAALLGLLAWWQGQRAEREAWRAQEQLAKNDWFNAVKAKREGDGLRASHFFATSAAETRRPEMTKNALLNLQAAHRRVHLGSQFRHEYLVVGATLSKDQRLVLTWSWDGTARLWNAIDGSPAAEPMKHEKRVSGAAFSDDQRLVLTWSEEAGTARLWNLEDGSPAAEPLRHEDALSGAVFSDDQRLVLTWSWDGTARLWNAADGSLAAEPMKHESSVLGAVFSDDQRLVLTWSYDGATRLWNAADGSPAAEPMEHESRVSGAAFSDDQRLVLTWSEAGMARLWNAADGSPAAETMKHERSVRGAAFSDDQRLVLTWSYDGTARLWNVADGSPAAEPMRHEKGAWGAVFSDDQRLVLSWSEDGTARLWNAADGSPAAEPMRHDAPIVGAAFSDDQRLVLTWSGDGTARLWNAADGSPAAETMKHERSVRGAAFSDDQRLVLTWSEDGTARLWNAADGSPAAEPMKHEGGILGAAFSDDQRLVLTWSWDGAVRLWNVTDGFPAEPMKHEGGILGAAFSDDQRLVLTWSWDGTARLWNAADGSPAAEPMEHEQRVMGAAFSDDQRLVLTWSWDGTARLWNAVDGSPAAEPIRPAGGVSGAAFSDDQRFVLTWSDDGTVWLWNVADGTPAAEPIRHEGGITGAAFSDDQRLVLTWSDDGTTRLWNVADGSPAAEPMKHERGVKGAVFSDDQRLVLTWSYDGTARLWNAADGSPAAEPMKHNASIRGAAFSDDQRLVFTWSDDGTARLWNAADGSPAAEPMKPEGIILGAAFSDDQRLVLTWSWDGTARLWNVADGSPAAEPMRHEQPVLGAAFSDDQRLVLTWSWDGTARLWNVADGSPVAEPMKHEGEVRGAAFSDDQRLVLTWSDDGTARLWDISADYDFPPDELPLLVQVVTGTEMDDIGNVSALPPDEWYRLKEEYVQVAEEHLKTCRYPDANLYARQKAFWQPEGR